MIKDYQRSPRENLDSTILSRFRLRQLNPPPLRAATPFWVGEPAFRWGGAQKTGSGSCLIYMESCNEVTQKRNQSMQGQSAFLRHCRRFFFNDFKIWIFPPPRSAKRTPRDLSKKKRNCTLRLSLSWVETTPGTEHFRTIFLSRLPHSAGAAETSVSVSVKNFIISWKYTISVLLNLGGLRSKLLNS